MKALIKGIYHWSEAGVASWYDFAISIQEEALAIGVLSKQIPVFSITTEEYPTPTKRPAYSVLDSMRSWRDFNIDPMHWRVALRQMLGSM